MADEQRPDWSKDTKKVVWNQCRMLRDANKASSEAADLIMQALEAAPELDEAMVLAFGIRTAQSPVRTPLPT